MCVGSITKWQSRTGYFASAAERQDLRIAVQRGLQRNSKPSSILEVMKRTFPLGWYFR